MVTAMAWPSREAARSLVGACHPEPTAAVTALTVALAAATGRSVAGVVGVGAAVLTGQLSVGWHNDWLDAERDRATHRVDKPLVQGGVGRRTVGTAAGVALLATVPLSLLSGWRAGLAHIVAVLLAWGYNARLKGTVWSWAPYAASFALLVAFLSLGRPGHPGPPWWGLVAAALLGVGAHLANVVPDLEDDAATGVRGLPHRLGRVRSVAGASALLLIASAVVALGPGHPGWTALGLPVAAALVAAGLVAYRRGREALLFRASLAVALVDVAMLVSRGRQL
jgi:4-hydroxybenzoate polyprenyltransferase